MSHGSKQVPLLLQTSFVSTIPTMSKTAMALAATGLVAVPAFLSATSAPRAEAPTAAPGLRGAQQKSSGSPDTAPENHFAFLGRCGRQRIWGCNTGLKTFESFRALFFSAFFGRQPQAPPGWVPPPAWRSPCWAQLQPSARRCERRCAASWPWPMRKIRRFCKLYTVVGVPK